MKTAALITHSHPPGRDRGGRDRGRGRPRGRLAPGRHRGRARQARRRRRGRRGRQRRDDAPDICLVLGGDGSILHALRRFARTGVPVFGVNFGTVGFLAAVERDEAGGRDPPRPRRRDRDGRAARPRGQRSTAPARSASTTSPWPAARTTGSPS